MQRLSSPPDNRSEKAVKAAEEPNTLENDKRGVASVASCQLQKKETCRFFLYDHTWRHLRYDIMHVTPWVVGAVVVAEAVQNRLGFELVLVCDWMKYGEKKEKTKWFLKGEVPMKERRKKGWNPEGAPLVSLKSESVNGFSDVFRLKRAAWWSKLSRQKGKVFFKGPRNSILNCCTASSVQWLFRKRYSVFTLLLHRNFLVCRELQGTLRHPLPRSQSPLWGSSEAALNGLGYNIAWGSSLSRKHIKTKRARFAVCSVRCECRAAVHLCACTS